jgi:HEPN domain-containing protein
MAGKGLIRVSTTGKTFYRVLSFPVASAVLSYGGRRRNPFSPPARRIASLRQRVCAKILLFKRKTLLLSRKTRTLMDTDNNIKNVEKVFQYWLSSSDNDYDAMLNLYQSENYNWALFLGHIVLEKLIKAYFVKMTETHALHTHNLRLLAKKSGLELTPDMMLQFDVITGFNINARYDTYKEDFHKRCTPEFSAEWIKNIKNIRSWIKEKL